MSGETREIPLTQGRVAIVDTADYKWLNQWKWYYSADGYAARMDRTTGKQQRVLMHRSIMGNPSHLVDHKNINGIDNRRSNLRAANKAQNAYNATRPKSNKSGYKGVSFCKLTNRWRASIRLAGKEYNLGRYATKEEAAKAYDARALQAHGEFARLNFS